MRLQVAQDLADEAAELHAFLETLDEKDWETPTLFMKWTPWDIVAHLHYSDEVSLASLEGEVAFAAYRKKVIESASKGLSLSQLTRDAFGSHDAPALLAGWKSSCDELAARFGESNPKRRLPWFGPDMGVQMFTTARLMEVWSHAQAIYDLKNVQRTHSDRIKNIVAIGVKTFGWTFVNRKLEIPGPPPLLRLTAPSGELWEYNDPSEDERVEGRALDFCLVVTQVRNVKDTDLSVVGDIAKRWMDIAQCFAGPPVDPPVPGYRTGG